MLSFSCLRKSSNLSRQGQRMLSQSSARLSAVKAPLEISSVQQFKSTITASSKNSEPIIVDFYANWCGPCKLLTPLLVKACQDSHVQLLKVNVDEQQQLAQEYSVTALPTVVALKAGGQELNRFMGLKDARFLKDFCQSLSTSSSK